MEYERYKTRFPQSYRDGAANITVRISAEALKLLSSRIKNQSAFINDLILYELRDGTYEKKQRMALLNEAVAKVRESGIEVELNLKAGSGELQ